LPDKSVAMLFKLKKIPEIAIPAVILGTKGEIVIDQTGEKSIQGTNSVLTFGPYWSLPHGCYTLSYELKDGGEKFDNVSVFIEVKSFPDDKIYARKDLAAKNISKNYKRYNLYFKNNGADSRLEFKTTTTGIANINVRNLYLSSFKCKNNGN
jgi:hypothetical protein